MVKSYSFSLTMILPSSCPKEVRQEYIGEPCQLSPIQRVEIRLAPAHVPHGIQYPVSLADRHVGGKQRGQQQRRPPAHAHAPSHASEGGNHRPSLMHGVRVPVAVVGSHAYEHQPAATEEGKALHAPAGVQYRHHHKPRHRHHDRRE